MRTKLTSQMRIEQLGDSEVGDLDEMLPTLPWPHQDVVRLDIAMNDPIAMGRVETAADLKQNRGRNLKRHERLSVAQLCE